MLYSQVVLEASFRLSFERGAKIPSRAPTLEISRGGRVVQRLQGQPLRGEPIGSTRKIPGPIKAFTYTWVGSTNHPDGKYTARVSSPEGEAELEFWVDHQQRFENGRAPRKIESDPQGRAHSESSLR